MSRECVALSSGGHKVTLPASTVKKPVNQRLMRNCFTHTQIKHLYHEETPCPDHDNAHDAVYP